MKDYKEIADSVFQRSEKIIAENRRRKGKIIRTAAACLCITAVLGVGIWYNGSLSNASYDGDIVTTESSGYPNVEADYYEIPAEQYYEWGEVYVEGVRYAPAEKLPPLKDGRYYRDGDTSKDYYEVKDGYIQYRIDDRECMHDLYDFLSENWGFSADLPPLGSYDEYVDSLMVIRIDADPPVTWDEPQKFEQTYEDNSHRFRPGNNLIEYYIIEDSSLFLYYENENTIASTFAWSLADYRDLHYIYVENEKMSEDTITEIDTNPKAMPYYSDELPIEIGGMPEETEADPNPKVMPYYSDELHEDMDIS